MNFVYELTNRLYENVRARSDILAATSQELKKDLIAGNEINYDELFSKDFQKQSEDQLANAVQPF